MQQTRRSSFGRAVEPESHDGPDDDWLGDISDDDWSENAAERSERRRATLAYQSLPAPADELAHDSVPARSPSSSPHETSDPRRASLGRRRIAAALVLALVLGLGVVIAALAVRGGDQPVATTTSDSTPEGPTTTDPSDATATTTSTTPTTPQADTTTPGTDDAPAFSLPAGTKLQRGGQGDPALIRELQRALAGAGFEPGPVDGTFGQRTEAAVVAFQLANGLSVDGRVGPETAEALNRALAGG